MKIIEIADLYSIDYTVKVINALTQCWIKTKTFNCIGYPKRNDMLLLLDGCDAIYTLKNGKKLYAENGSIVYLPFHSEYSVEFLSSDNEPCKTTHINFTIFDYDNSQFTLSSTIEIISADNANYKTLFNKIDSLAGANIQCHAKIKSIMYDLMFKISEFYLKKQNSNKFSIIEQGIEYLEQRDDLSLSIAEIAGICNVSEVYFRRLFKEYSGFTPSEYRMTARIIKAKNYLKHEEISIAEISDRIGFAEVSYFIKVFKAQTGTTPAKYRKNCEENA